MMSHIRHVALALLVLATGCGPSAGIGGLLGSPSSAHRTVHGSDAGTGTGASPTPAPSTRSISDRGTGFTLKSADLIDNTVKACLGGGRTLIVGDVLIKTTDKNTTVTGGGGTVAPSASPSPNAAEPITFLSAASYNVGDDILQVDRDLFDGKEQMQRLGVRTTMISVEYLTALKNVANVVAYNCSQAHLDPGSGSELCECDTPDKARELLGRCLSTFNPQAYSQMVDDFAAACAKDQRSALASLIASYAFAAAP